MTRYSKDYVVSELAIHMIQPWQEVVTESFVPFQGQVEVPSWQISFEEKEFLTEPVGEKVFENQGFLVMSEEKGQYIRRFHDYRTNYAVYAQMKMDVEQKKVLIEYLSEGKGHFDDSRKDFFHIGWEKILICESRFMLHSACVDTKYGGILFSGPSGIGKSTQAELWRRYQNAKLLNGDRPIVRKTENGWKAYGSPYAGSSKCHVNERCDIRAIVMLRKAEQNTLRKLNVIEAFRKVYEQVIVNSWDRDYVVKASDLILALVDEVPVYELSCKPDETAVKYLAEELKMQADHWRK